MVSSTTNQTAEIATIHLLGLYRVLGCFQASATMETSIVEAQETLSCSATNIIA